MCKSRFSPRSAETEKYRLGPATNGLVCDDLDNCFLSPMPEMSLIVDLADKMLERILASAVAAMVVECGAACAVTSDNVLRSSTSWTESVVGVIWHPVRAQPVGLDESVIKTGLCGRSHALKQTGQIQISKLKPPFHPT